ATLIDLKSDLKAVIQKIHDEHPAAQLVLYGHSMGGLTALSYTTENDPSIAGVIASSPWIELLNPPPLLLIKMASVAAKIFPSCCVRTGIKAKQLTLNGSGKSTKTDPLIHKKISIQLFTDMWNESRRIRQNGFRPNVPILLMFGSQDRLISYQTGEQLAKGAIEYKLWDETGHDLHLEIGNGRALQYIVKWIHDLL
ncbi:MAG: lysophospholipase, partial [Bacteroidales bacterium]|nr:lysophospholipase [Bacteroidales bacterium]